MFQNSAKQEYDQAIFTRENYQDSMKKEGISRRTDFEKQFNTLGKMEARVPEFNNQIQIPRKRSCPNKAIMKGIEQAERNKKMTAT